MRLSVERRTQALAATHALYLLALAYALAYVVFDDAMLPNGAGFALALLYVAAALAGRLVSAISSRAPPLLGMLAAGMLLRNASASGPLETTIPLLGHSFGWWSTTLRSAALGVIMLRAGLGLDLRKLVRMGPLTARLGVLPCLGEAAVVAVLAWSLLSLPPAWGGLLGFVVAAVSPAVVVPGMLDLQSRGYGTVKGVPTVVIAAASFDDVLAVAGFSVCLALALSADGGGTLEPIAWLVLKGPVELVGGCLAGLMLGLACAHPWFGRLRGAAHTPATLIAAFLCIFGGKRTGFSGGGVLGAVVIGCAASWLWTRSGHAEQLAGVRLRVQQLWTVAQPALFGLVGAAVQLRAIDASQLGVGCAVLAVGLAVRVLVTRLATLGSALTPSEANFVCIAWLPKATVQAAVGGTALDMVVERGLGDDAMERGRLVLTLSVLVILMTAPIGAAGIALSGPKLLALEELPAQEGGRSSTVEGYSDSVASSDAPEVLRKDQA